MCIRDRTLLLVCEEGEEEYNEKKFAFPGVTLKVLEDKAELNLSLIHIWMFFFIDKVW